MVTAKEFLIAKNVAAREFQDILALYLIEFAQLHVKEAKKQFKIVFSEIDNPYPFEYNDPLEDVYPLNNVK